MSYYRNKKVQGFTLMELIVAIALFSIIMLAVIQIFGRAFQTYRETRSLQRNLESAQFAMNLMAKELRTSSILSQSTTSVRFYDYSQDQCILYSMNLSNGILTKASAGGSGATPALRRANCDSQSLGSEATMLTGISTGAFSVTASTAPTTRSVGKVTLAMKIGTAAANRTIQSSVSLRDYDYTGL